jgi:tRNA(Arg) A34 adenosine deaminase TadA
MNESEKEFMRRAITLAQLAMNSGAGGPYGAVVVKDGKIVGESGNQVKINHDPTAHAEIEAIRKACSQLSVTDLEGCELYASCEPCPMCTSAIYISKVSKVFYACTRADSTAAGFDNTYIYDELALYPADRKISMENGLRQESLKVFEDWLETKG